uniref:Uncharacterized protein n=2 Tax=viral metagenome TaxID=1070528 RepID=A0A6M3LHG9_9ZZZZ
MKRFVIKKVEDKWEFMEFNGWKLVNSQEFRLVRDCYRELNQVTKPIENKVYSIEVREVK